MAAKKLGRPSNESRRLTELEAINAEAAKYIEHLEKERDDLREKLEKAKKAWSSDNGHTDVEITKLSTDLREAHRYIGELTIRKLRSEGSASPD